MPSNYQDQSPGPPESQRSSKAKASKGSGEAGESGCGVLLVCGEPQRWAAAAEESSKKGVSVYDGCKFWWFERTAQRGYDGVKETSHEMG